MGFRTRLILSISVLLAISFGIGGTLLISASFSSSLEEECEAALTSFEAVQNTLYLLNSLGGQADHESLSGTLSRIEGQGPSNLRCLSLAAPGEAPRIPGQEALPLPAEGQCAYTEVSDESGQGLLVLGWISAGDDRMALGARFDLTPVYQARAAQQKLFLSVYAAVVLLGVLTSALLSFALTGSLKKLTGAVRKISGGDLDTRSGLRSRDEFGQLSRDFDAMADKLQETIRRLEAHIEGQEAFMGAFAHEIKTPMTSIIGYADLLRQDGLEDKTRLLAADYIFSEGQRLEKLSFKLLDLLLLKKERPDMKEVNLHGFLQEVEKLLSPGLEKRDIRLCCQGEAGKVLMEPDLVKSLLYNLVDNAAKAIEGPGTITVTGALLPGGCRIQVSDTGRGMEAGELPKITGAFYRVDKARSRAQGGAGLGLCLCKEIAALHHGGLAFESALGKGTQVTVTLYGARGDSNA